LEAIFDMIYIEMKNIEFHLSHVCRGDIRNRTVISNPLIKSPVNYTALANPCFTVSVFGIYYRSVFLVA